MAKLWKRALIVLVPAWVVGMISWLATALALRGLVSAEVYWLGGYGAIVLLVVLTGWMAARHGDLGRWAAAFAGASVFLLGRILRLAAAGMLRPQRPGLGWLPIGGIIVVVVVLLPVILSLGYLGAWIATRERPKPRRA
jgi:hypothetical protein